MRTSIGKYDYGISLFIIEISMGFTELLNLILIDGFLSTE